MTWLGKTVVCNLCGAATDLIGRPAGWVAFANWDWCPECYKALEADWQSVEPVR